ncbi:hypothetical protein CPB86DRAFT_815142 [Serendipita vermifera]|nr:hypothetical protein CPB86DRAFT_815142 [Serendipita vermifera]
MPRTKKSQESTDLIIVIGQIRSGKSSFINSITGSQHEIGHDTMTQCTKSVLPSEPFFVDGRKLILLDTPGFTDNVMEDVETVERIQKNLKRRRDRFPIGLLYFHDITENKISENVINILQTCKTWGKARALPLTIVITWSDALPGSNEDEKRRKAELKMEQLSEQLHTNESFVGDSATFLRYDKGETSCNDVIRSVLLRCEPNGPQCSTTTLASQDSTDNTDTREQVIIGVMGPSGSGKSTFINLIAGSGFAVGDGLTRCTNRPEFTEPFLLEERKVVLLDTPGFQFEDAMDMNILKEYTNIMATMYRDKKPLSGLLYFHDISISRMGGTAVRNVRLFESICGQDALKSVIIVTNMWGKVTEAEGSRREKSLQETGAFFQPLVQRGARFMRHTDTKDSARNIINALLSEKNKPHLALQVQIVDHRRQWEETSAAMQLVREFDALTQNIQSRIKQEERLLAGDSPEDRKKRELAIRSMKNRIKDLEGRKQVTVQGSVRKQFCNPHFEGLPLNSVIGPTGSGKSTFINAASGSSDMKVGHHNDLTSCTTGVTSSKRFEVDGQDVILLDTPGWDGTEGSFLDLHDQIQDHLTKQFKGQDLKGIIYTHGIDENRPTASIKGVLKALQQACADNPECQLLVATTMWEEVNSAVGFRREWQLKTEPFFMGPLAEAGVKFVRHLGSDQSARLIVHDLLSSRGGKTSKPTVSELVGKLLRQLFGLQ